ncbi:MAG TPA: C4-type zinc ribbon domain-containing protein [Candidatus Nanopelagicales bacterium]|nr:C4-type zinc ribbon domain-containing protein [Candidatus Nanopelagicales bacterium]
MELPPTEVAEIRAAAPDEVMRCEECRCILVRTDESGL